MTCTIRNTNCKSQISQLHGQSDTTRDVCPCGGRGVKEPSTKPCRNRKLEHAGVGPSATLGKTSHHSPSSQLGASLPRTRRPWPCYLLAEEALAWSIPIIDEVVVEHAGGQSSCGAGAYEGRMDASTAHRAAPFVITDAVDELHERNRAISAMWSRRQIAWPRALQLDKIQLFLLNAKMSWAF
ncbi:hypothetical protein BU16DRAFT_568455 [Lophium mytilinum]|uniref:Uncharacterized protein n=1 Tax=Lophium mytilinum TaxID=390894 RepID=A0A6A6Q9L9_9PEZI|nr:hypothetical protein BU16DRAFT_568455 [Lophium mytilinum]